MRRLASSPRTSRPRRCASRSTRSGEPGKPGRADPERDLRRDALRRMGCQDRHAHHGPAGVHEPAPVRTGRGPRAAADRATKSIRKRASTEPEYVNIFGVPFTFLPHEEAGNAATTAEPRTRIEPVPEQEGLRDRLAERGADRPDVRSPARARSRGREAARARRARNDPARRTGAHGRRQGRIRRASTRSPSKTSADATGCRRSPSRRPRRSSTR